MVITSSLSARCCGVSRRHVAVRRTANAVVRQSSTASPAIPPSQAPRPNIISTAKNATPAGTLVSGPVPGIKGRRVLWLGEVTIEPAFRREIVEGIVEEVPVLLVCRFVVPPAETEAFLARARRAVELLTAGPGCSGADLGRATEADDRWVLSVRFDSIVAYRRALSPFPVREEVIPLLAEALADEPAAYELVVSAVDGSSIEQRSVLAADGRTVRLGEAAGPSTSTR
ncbi:hypothetical protein D5S17_08385 [Pseudonocardiaceae bacterium YIM PH 21723]|nr:hypothetical protein D5S17_08385 [Pseudonocardiaceae bacterium YIM PH 21723]